MFKFPACPDIILQPTIFKAVVKMSSIVTTFEASSGSHFPHPVPAVCGWKGNHLHKGFMLLRRTWWTEEMLANLQASFLLSTVMKHPRMAWKVSSKFYKTSVGGEDFRERYRFLSVILKLLYY